MIKWKKKQRPIATIQEFPEMTLIYDINEDFVTFKNGSAYVDSRYYVEKDKLHKKKLYQTTIGKHYFIHNGRRYHLDNAMRTL